MKNEKSKSSNGRKYIFAALLTFALVISAAAQTVNFSEGDTVQTPDGRTGKIESFKNGEMAKVRFGAGASDTQYFMLKDLKVVNPSGDTFRVGDMAVSPQ